jgi:hypothetical protein
MRILQFNGARQIGLARIGATIARFDYTCRWETRTYDLSQLRGVDTYIVYWGSPWIAHTMLSFEFGKDEYIVFSIETRKELGQFYSAIKGFFRLYELIYIVSDERDVVRLRTNYRTGEDVYLYHLNMPRAGTCTLSGVYRPPE